MSTINTTNLKNPSSGSNNVVLNADGTTTLTPSNIIKSATAVASTSGTSIDFTGIPSWVKRITVMLNGVSTNGSSLMRFRLGTSSGFATSGYTGATSYSGSGGAGGAFNSAGFDSSGDGIAAGERCGALVFSNLSGNTWTVHGLYSLSSSVATAFTVNFGGVITLSGTLDRIRITTVNGTDTFDAGSVNILME